MAGEIRFNFEPGQVDEAIAYEQAKVVHPALENIEQLSTVASSGLWPFLRGAARSTAAMRIKAIKINTASEANAIERSIRANRQANQVLRPYFDHAAGRTPESLHAPLDEADEHFATVIKNLAKRAYDNPPRARQDETKLLLLDTSEPGWKPSPGAIVQSIEAAGFDSAQDQFAANRQVSDSGEVSTHATIFPDQWTPAGGSDGMGGHVAQNFRPLTASYVEVGLDIRISITASTQSGPDESLQFEPLGP